MIAILSGFPSNVVAVAVSGRVQRSEYDAILVPALERALASNDKVRLYYVMAQDFGSLEPGAMWEDFKLGMEHLTRWERIAVVSDIGWVKHTMEAFSFLLPAKVRTFGGDKVDEAKAWIVAK